MRTFLAHQLAQQHPHHDPHPLAREDGGWYPGKHFDPTDILTDPKNWTVWKQFLLFFFGILLVPVLSFIVVEWILRVVFHLKFQRSQTIGAVVAIIVLQIFMISYARRAVLEERADYAEQQQQEMAREKSATVDEADHKSQNTTGEDVTPSAKSKGAKDEDAKQAQSPDQPNIDKEGGGSLIAEDGSVAKDGEDASVSSAMAQEEPMPEKLDSDLGLSGQVKKRK